MRRDLDCDSAADPRESGRSATPGFRSSRFDGWRRERYLDAIYHGATLTQAARAGGVSVWTAARHRRADSTFAAAVRVAEQAATEKVESALFNAAVSGNVRAMIVYLERRCPERWGPPGDRRAAVDVPKPAAVAVETANVQPSSMGVTELRAQAIKLLAEAAQWPL